MAKSIFEILDDLNTTTSVPAVKDKDGKVLRDNHGDVAHTFPREALPTSEEFESEEKLFEWARETGCLHACLQSGVQKRLIDLRAVFKAMPRKDSGEVWSPEYGQEKVDNAKWEIVKRPKQGGLNKVKRQAEIEAAMKIVLPMLQAKVDEGIILAALVPTYGPELASEILTTVKEGMES